MSWEGAQPHSTQFNDRYFSGIDGLAETDHVFIQGNRLPERFAALSPDARFSAGELGFGTGLNFIAAWRAFEQHAPPGATLNFVSTELAPLSAAAMCKALGAWPQIADKAQAVADACERLNPGFNLRLFAAGRIRLLLLVGDALDTLPQLEAHIDTWFLDGFAPARNPHLWSPEVCAELARLSSPSATLATFTAAGWVRRNLQAVGFSVAKQRGFGHKRDMTIGTIDAPRWVSALPEWARVPPRALAHVTIVGGGIIGAATAAAFAAAGVRVTVFDSRDPSAPSKLPGLLVRGFPERANDLRGRFYHAAFAHAAHALRGTPGWHPSGIALVHHFEKAPPAINSAEQLSALAGAEIATDGQWLPDAGWIDPAGWRAACLDHPSITVKHETWTPPVPPVSVAPDTHEQTLTILAAGYAGSPLAALAGLPHSSARGQLSEVAYDAAFSPRASVAGAGLCIADAGKAWLGASFVRGDVALDARPDEADGYLTKWAEHLPAASTLKPRRHAVGVRVGSADRMPNIGPIQTPGTGQPIWTNWAHGARGATAAMLSAECLVAMALGDPLPVPAEQVCALHPGRFVQRRKLKI